MDGKWVIIALLILVVTIIAWIRTVDMQPNLVTPAPQSVVEWVSDSEKRESFEALFGQSSGTMRLSIEEYSERLDGLVQHAKETDHVEEAKRSLKGLVEGDGILLNPRKYYVDFSEEWYTDYNERIQPFIEELNKSIAEL
jgi:hypothetical protein